MEDILDNLEPKIINPQQTATVTVEDSIFNSPQKVILKNVLKDNIFPKKLSHSYVDTFYNQSKRFHHINCRKTSAKNFGNIMSF